MSDKETLDEELDRMAEEILIGEELDKLLEPTPNIAAVRIAIEIQRQKELANRILIDRGQSPATLGYTKRIW